MEKANSRQNSEALARIGSSRRSFADSKADFHRFPRRCSALEETAGAMRGADWAEEDSPVAAMVVVAEPEAAQP